MKIFEDSPLELICTPLRLSPWHRNIALNVPHIYEHVFTLVVLAALINKFNLSIWIYLGAIAIHVIVKELIFDRIKHGDFNWPNLIERTYGALLGMLIIL